ncbi:MAG: DUF3662 and FHA domain-containing protein [Chloroflexi bacterium]|nr:DUF3662 and FHA domain-containing protein [Chloroflexota bacterium]
MAAVADLERLLERVFERTTARLFRAGIQVVQIERRVERAMEGARTPDGARIAVPARYRVRLHPSDLADVTSRAGGAEVVAVRLADNALTFARSHGYHLAGRPEVWLIADPAVERGQVEVNAGTRGTPGPVPQSPVPQSPVPPLVSPASPPARPGAVVPPAQPATSTSNPGASVVAVTPDPVPAASPSPPAPSEAPVVPATGIRGDGSQTAVFRRPAPQAAQAILRISARDGRERTIEVGGLPLTIGRSNDNVLVIDDGRVSRHHGRFQSRRGTLVYTDLGSTNGSRVNGVRVDEIVLGEGDRLQVGDVVMVVETLPG